MQMLKTWHEFFDKLEDFKYQAKHPELAYSIRKLTDGKIGGAIGVWFASVGKKESISHVDAAMDSYLKDDAYGKELTPFLVQMSDALLALFKDFKTHDNPEIGKAMIAFGLGLKFGANREHEVDATGNNGLMADAVKKAYLQWYGLHRLMCSAMRVTKSQNLVETVLWWAALRKPLVRAYDCHRTRLDQLAERNMCTQNELDALNDAVAVAVAGSWAKVDLINDEIEVYNIFS